MQLAYVFSTLGHHVATGFIKSSDAQDRGLDFYAVAQRSAATSLLGYAVGSLLFTLVFVKLLKKLSKTVASNLVGSLCLANIFVHLIISYDAFAKYNFEWLLTSFLWGIQSAILFESETTNCVNPIMEINEDNKDTFILMRTAGAFTIFIFGGILKNSRPIYLLLFLIVGLVLSVFLAFAGDDEFFEPAEEPRLPRRPGERQRAELLGEVEAGKGGEKEVSALN